MQKVTGYRVQVTEKHKGGFFRSCLQPTTYNLSPGFTLIEMLVSISIIALISTLVLANHNRFNNSLLLGNLAYDIALSIRQAQVYGLSVKGSGSNFQVGYGVHFSSPNSFIFYSDDNNNKTYDTGTDTIVETYAIGQGNRFLRFCGVTANNTATCSDDSPGLSYLDIVFFRPDPDAVIKGSSLGVTYSRAQVIVTSPAGDTREVDIASTGQISVKSQ